MIRTDYPSQGRSKCRERDWGKPIKQKLILATVSKWQKILPNQ